MKSLKHILLFFAAILVCGMSGSLFGMKNSSDIRRNQHIKKIKRKKIKDQLGSLKKSRSLTDLDKLVKNRDEREALWIRCIMNNEKSRKRILRMRARALKSIQEDFEHLYDDSSCWDTDSDPEFYFDRDNPLENEAVRKSRSFNSFNMLREHNDKKDKVEQEKEMSSLKYYQRNERRRNFEKTKREFYKLFDENAIGSSDASIIFDFASNTADSDTETTRCSHYVWPILDVFVRTFFDCIEFFCP